VKLSKLLEAIGKTGTEGAGAKDPDIGSIHYRAQDVRPGGLFVAVRGLTADGHDFIDQALDRGAVAAVTQRPVTAPGRIIVTENSRKALAALAARFYGDPAEAMVVIGITGTNGKTTTALLIESILTAAGFSTGVVGTIDYRYGGNTFANPMTTPESLDLQRILADMRNAGVSHVVMEVSSHALDLNRIHGCRIQLGVFTNLTQDHLDYHGTMENYWAAKKQLFSRHLHPRGNGPSGVINCDDPRGGELVRELAGPVLTVGTGSDRDVAALDARHDRNGIRATLRIPAGPIGITSALVGPHNLSNILCAAGAGAALNLSPGDIRSGIEALPLVPGRLEPVSRGTGPFVYVDYAHTPDALEHVLTVLRKLTRGRLICVFGCGGDRDRTKRPIMGELAGRFADLAVITSDNPRSEPPLAIIGEIQKGIEQTHLKHLDPEAVIAATETTGHTTVPDRQKAIELALVAAGPRDTVLIAGKGHETYQVIGKTVRDFDDRAEARAVLDRLAKRRASNGRG
jgi:UDP-N-acetylmuramoyl-L-alanyl-D-glutamate--2,6-diaminopimelate ligase